MPTPYFTVWGYQLAISGDTLTVVLVLVALAIGGVIAFASK